MGHRVTRYHADPYLYVGPWTDERPGDASFWNAPFGSVLGYRDLAATSDPVVTAAEFFLRGIELLLGLTDRSLTRVR